MKTCKYCNEEFEPNARRQEFCSSKCRVYFSRKRTASGSAGGETVTKPSKKLNLQKEWKKVVDHAMGESTPKARLKKKLSLKPKQKITPKPKTIVATQPKSADPVRSVLNKLPSYKF